MVRMGNIYYFLYILIAIIITVLAVVFLRNKSQRFRHWFIFGIIMLAFTIHFLKIFIWPYTTVEAIFTKVSFENICAVSTLVFPFLYFTKNKTLKDYMVMVGMASGIITFIFPVDAMSEYFNGTIIGYRSAFNLEVMRFYFAHYLLFLIPFLMMRYQMHELSIHRAYRAPLVLILVLVLIFVNELIMTLFNWVPKEDLYDPSKRNPSFIFGVRGDLTGLGLFLGIFVPYFMRVHPLTGASFYWPVIWLIIPAIVYGGLMVLIFMFVYDYQETKLFFGRILGARSKEEVNIDLPK
ncbi:MAG: hypothetical protein K9L02_05665 [Acholeplasmataceae bacterium]|nr:hypothetical protein [Acholeplasmataceae bacterium]